MITKALIRRMEEKTAAYRREVVARFGQGVPFSYIHMFYKGCDGIEDIYHKMMQDQLRINERGMKRMKSKKGPSKLKLAKTAKAKKALKAKKK